jgi:hypothetical protein
VKEKSGKHQLESSWKKSTYEKLKHNLPEDDHIVFMGELHPIC